MTNCLECGKASAAGRFCSDACSRAHQLRRLKRGVLVYDMLMGNRFERKFDRNRQGDSLFGLAEIFREEDRRERAGRRSWADPPTVQPTGDNDASGE